MYKEKQKNMGAEQYEEDIKVQRLIPVLHKLHVFHNSIINSSFERKDMQQIQKKNIPVTWSKANRKINMPALDLSKILLPDLCTEECVSAYNLNAMPLMW